MLKADLHLHAGEDVFHKLGYTSKELIDFAVSKGFEVMALTFHRDVFYNEELADYAKKKGVLLIPGTEKWIDGKETLIYNITQEQAQNINTFKELKDFKKNHDIIVIAPHPYFKTSHCLGDELEENIDVFDAIEYSHYYLPYFNLNKKAEKIAKKYGLPMVGNSDAHNFSHMNTTYTLINSKKDLKSVFNAIKQRKVKVKTKPVSLKYFISRIIRMVFSVE